MEAQEAGVTGGEEREAKKRSVQTGETNGRKKPDSACLVNVAKGCDGRESIQEISDATCVDRHRPAINDCTGWTAMPAQANNRKSSIVA
jgi:hypothetical protein